MSSGEPAKLALSRDTCRGVSRQPPASRGCSTRAEVGQTNVVDVPRASRPATLAGNLAAPLTSPVKPQVTICSLVERVNGGLSMSSDTPEVPPSGNGDGSAAGPRLPDSYATRWDPARKALVVEAVESGTMRLERALVLYRMSHEEYDSWREAWRPSRSPAVASRQARSLAFGRKRSQEEQQPSPEDA